MSGLRHRREDYNDRDRDRDRGRYRERRSRSRERPFRQRRSNSRSPTHNYSSSRHHYSSKRDSRQARFSGHRQSVSRSRSRSNSRSKSRTYSRFQKRSRSPPNSLKGNRRSRSPEHNSDTHSHKNREESNHQKNELVAGKKTDEGPLRNSSSVEDLPLPPKKEPEGAYYNLSTEEPIDKEKIHREIEEKLRLALAKEGKVYPPPKPEASHPVFANDGSFIEIFKKMQQARQQAPIAGVHTAPIAPVEVASTSTAAAYVSATAVGKPAPPPPIVGRRRGGKILKTGLVAKPKAQGDESGDPKDFWSIYLREVNKYKNNACESDGGTRPLVK